MTITKNTKVKEVFNSPVFESVKDQIMTAADFLSENGELTFEELERKYPTWYHDDMIYGLNRLQDAITSGNEYVFSVYSEAEIKNNPRLSSVKLIYLPTAKENSGSYAILMAGGAYHCVCPMVEAFPVAARLNELGVSCFSLTYRVAPFDSDITGLLPQPMDDLAAAWKFINRNAGKFNVKSDEYIAGGFSAGGHLVSQWGTKHNGARKYGIPQAKMLMLLYPLISMEYVTEPPDIMCKKIYGEGYTLADMRNYDATHHLDDEFPKVFLTSCMDDGIITPNHLKAFIDKLQSSKTRCAVELKPTGGHGFGLGSKTDASGWVERAMEFLF